jgi:UTP--glucose-1-phosphate uridylyltransferase
LKAVIPAAGLGTRFLPYTKAQPKEMLPVVDKPAIQYVVEEAAASGLRDILIVTGRGKRAIEDHFDRSVELEGYLRRSSKDKELEQMQEIGSLANIMYVRQKEPLGLGHAILCAEPFVGEEPFAVLLGDDILIDSTPCTKKLVDVFEKRHAAVLAVQEMPMRKVGAYGVVSCKSIGESLYEVDGIVEKPSPEKANSNLVSIGRYILPPSIFRHLKSLKPGVGGEIQLTDGIRELLKSEKVFAMRFDGKRYDIGDRMSWLKANIELAMGRPEFKEGFEEFLKEFSGK